MKNLFLFFGITLFAFFSFKNISSEGSPLESFVDSLFKESLDSSRIAGGAILVAQNGEVLLHKTYGYASIELSVPMPLDAQFEIGSVTKQFTAAAILKLVEAGKLSLDDDFTKYMDYDTKGRTVTIAQLLNHTSGIPGYTEIDEFWPLSIEQHPRDSLVRLVEGHDFLFEPNEALIYNNSAYFFLGLIIEKVSGKSYEEYLEEQFFTPLAMHHTHYCSNSEVVKNKVYGYNFTPSGLQQKPYIDHTWPYAAGSICSSVGDLYIWSEALHNGKVFKNDLYQQMITPGALNNGAKLSYAMGLVHYMNYGNREISHGGGIHGFLSHSCYYPEEDLHIICLTNTTGPNGGSYFTERVAFELMEKKEYQAVTLDVNPSDLAGIYKGEVRGSELSAEMKAIPEGFTVQYNGEGPLDTLSLYVGNHTWMDGNTTVIVKDGECRVDEVYGYYILKKE